MRSTSLANCPMARWRLMRASCRRVLMELQQRRKRMGNQLMEQVHKALCSKYGSARSALAAQAHLQGFYGQHGYVAVSAEYALDGIPHVDMVRNED